MKKYQFFLFFLTMSLSVTAFGSSLTTDGLIFNEKGTASACQGFAHPDCFRTDEENLQDAKMYTDSRARNKCQDEGYELAILIGEHECDVDKVPGYSVTTTCSGFYRCE